MFYNAGRNLSESSGKCSYFAGNQIALHFGADDFGGTLLEENVHAAANFINTTNAEECRNMIKEYGFIPAQRTKLNEIIKVEEKSSAA